VRRYRRKLRRKRQTAQSRSGDVGCHGDILAVSPSPHKTQTPVLRA
jgi:hypothetical protein